MQLSGIYYLLGAPCLPVSHGCSAIEAPSMLGRLTFVCPDNKRLHLPHAASGHHTDGRIRYSTLYKALGEAAFHTLAPAERQQADSSQVMDIESQKADAPRHT